MIPKLNFYLLNKKKLSASAGGEVWRCGGWQLGGHRAERAGGPGLGGTGAGQLT